MLYMFLLYSEPGTEFPPSILDDHLAFTARQRERGGYISSEALGHAPSWTVRVRNGKVQATDGPFAETKEVLGGFYILDCEDLEGALAAAAEIPDANVGSVEVRPILGIPDWPYAVGADRKRQPIGAGD